MLCILLQRFLRVRHFCLEYSESNETDDSDKEESDRLGSRSGSFGTCGTGSGGLLYGIKLPAGVTPAGNDGSFDGGG